ncbi:MAG: thiamine pyrophosphate-dependent enzyme [Candidatus Firestonebacteria bacterium]|nr:thiamine pyrophosphate-dependent enzyme [Candidatus Firestonebacteria bacterium]
MKAVYNAPKSLKKTANSYCPGCGHGLVQRILAEVIDELGVREKTIGIAPVGCAVFTYDYFNFDVTEAPHGRPPAVATAIKRCLPDRIVFTYQGDGDLASIGTNEILHAANRGENITVVFINNAVYGMTGGQMAPTTLPGMKTTTSREGRDTTTAGFPLRVCELLSTLEGVEYIERVALFDPANVIKTKKAIKKAFQNQVDGKGFSFVEVLSPCPINWGLRPLDSLKYIKEKMLNYFKLGIIKDRSNCT